MKAVNAASRMRPRTAASSPPSLRRFDVERVDIIGLLDFGTTSYHTGAEIRYQPVPKTHTCAEEHDEYERSDDGNSHPRSLPPAGSAGTAGNCGGPKRPGLERRMARRGGWRR